MATNNCLGEDGLQLLIDLIKAEFEKYTPTDKLGEISANSITKIEQTTKSTEDDGDNVITITLSNGVTATFTIQNGSKGSTGATGPQGPEGPEGPQGPTGPAGDDGYTPQRGIDYWTPKDQAQMQSDAQAYYDEITGDVNEALDAVLLLQDTFIGEGVEPALDDIIELQNDLIGGESV